MSLSKIVLFYVFTPLTDPDAIRLWQQTLCEAVGVRGRIIVSPHGINATVGGEIGAVKKYVAGTKRYSAFADADIKWSDGGAEDFPRLQVRVRPEIVSFGRPDEVHVDDRGVIGGGRRLDPDQLHELIADRGDEVVLFDGRNRIESRIGHLRGAVLPEVETTREFVDLLDSGRYDHLKDRPVVTYCTGGVRCEVLSSLMHARGFADVYQLDGGIVNYGKRFGDDGLWRGSLYVFDKRMSLQFSDHAEVVGRCDACDAPTDAVRNHPDENGRDLAVVCPSCAAAVPAPINGVAMSAVR
ncbi:rhodanese-related sulfurtransferase [Williamsia sp.]|uniref:oxygen-dependent tRNA uridine(34) hydroxylase TrhO n=1 Tax=Williamsia sp. TaxID=1872085 RepID=UPI001A2CD308|nr:rhodanese-related sulfurtransferase [Williamsia sp.]MBJ7290310.1 rhodanese-related sulfurtransferase [Williamsia sp.]